MLGTLIWHRATVGAGRCGPVRAGEGGVGGGGGGGGDNQPCSSSLRTFDCRKFPTVKYSYNCKSNQNRLIN